jgi:arylsulfatase A-like enzyme
VVLVADHGDEFHEHGAFGHGQSFYQELLAVPLVISGLPGREPGTRETAVVGHIDIAPTLLAAAGIRVDELPGQDLAGPVEPRVYLSEDARLDGKPGERPDRIAALEGHWKLIEGPDGTMRLFDLASDPREEHSLAPTHPDVVARLTAAIPKEGPAGVVGMKLSHEDRRMLEALGYAE